MEKLNSTMCHLLLLCSKSVGMILHNPRLFRVVLIIIYKKKGITKILLTFSDFSFLSQESLIITGCVNLMRNIYIQGATVHKGLS